MEEQAKQIPEISLVNIFFQKTNFSQIRGAGGEIKLNIKNSFDFQFSKSDSIFKASLITKIEEPSNIISVEVVAVGLFKMREDCNWEELKYKQIAINTIWPFSRSQISLLTTQPGIKPILLPLANPRVNEGEGDSYA